jgi:GR25 family glycosyltransferase involved in LPS biosynthesis
MEGLNNFDVVYYINLKHRKDRFDHITNELKKTNISPSKINRIEGVYLKDFGILGCAKSHVKALEEFINSGKDNCLIFEDDFIFTKDSDFINNIINEFFRNVESYDVLMLSSNILNSEKTEYEFLTKIIDAQTLSGYSVSKKFAPILLENFKESIQIQEHYGRKMHPICFDIYMKKLQPNNNWYCLNPRIGKQIKSYSDIENNVVDYGC